MRTADTYRAAKRNQCREDHTLEEWRLKMLWWQEANQKAKLGERQKQCAAARRRVALLRLRHIARTVGVAEINKVLLKFWQGQKYTRVVARIIKQLQRERLTTARA